MAVHTESPTVLSVATHVPRSPRHGHMLAVCVLVPLTGTKREGTEPASVASLSLVTETPGESGCRLCTWRSGDAGAWDAIYPSPLPQPPFRAPRQPNKRIAVEEARWRAPMVEGVKMAQPLGCARAPKSPHCEACLCLTWCNVCSASPLLPCAYVYLTFFGLRETPPEDAARCVGFLSCT